jgi:hypothetical protein
MLLRLRWVSTAFLVVVPASLGQVNNQWATFVRDPNRIRNPDGSIAAQVANDPDEKDYAWVDVDHDGWTDLIVVRKEIAASTGHRTNQLLMNEQGILVDRTSQYATDSDVPGDFGFMTPTNDRDVQCVDLDGDGWEDIVTATTLSDGDPKYISHPRVYRNKGMVGGVWQGFRYEEARIPQLLTAGGLAVAPRFCSVSVGDVNGDGFPDLYFADYDSTETGIVEPPTDDLDDRLLINDGFGYFTDSGTTLMSAAMLLSAFGTSSVIADFNGDGANDVMKDSTLNSPQEISVAYNDPTNLGHFNIFQPTASTGSPYHVTTGDLNADGKPDMIVSDDGLDYVRYNTGNDALGRVVWGPIKDYQYVSTWGDDGFAGTNLVVDLDGDGFPDTIHTDVDVDVPGCQRRCHIYHNPGGAVGSQMTLIEEAQNTTPVGWKGVVGPHIIDLQGTYDIAVFDIDHDGDLDMILGRCTGTQVWINQKFQPGAATNYCFGDGSGTACPCGNASLVGDNEGCLSSLGTGGKLLGSGGPSITHDTFHLTGSRMPNSSVLYFQGTARSAGGAGTSFGDGLRCAAGAVARLGQKSNANGGSTFPSGTDPLISVKGAVAAGGTRDYQAWYRNSAAFCSSDTFNLTNGVETTWQP